MNAQQIIDVGTVPNDLTGDKLRNAMIKVNANFTALYDAIISGPCCGTLYRELRAAIKYAFLTPLIDQHLYFIKKIYAGTVNGANKQYRLEIYKATTASLTGVMVGFYESNVAAYKTGMELITIVSTGISPGGITGCMVVDWDALVQGKSYACTNYIEGGLFSVITKDSISGAGGGGGAIDEITTDIEEPLTGESILVVCKSENPLSLPIAASANIVQSFTVKNEGGGSVTISAAGDELIDGYIRISLAYRQYVQIVPNNGRITAIGVYTGVEPT